MVLSSSPKEKPVAVITGASRGIGAAVARRLAADGFCLALTALHEDGLSKIADEIGTDRVFAQAGDSADEAFVQRFYQEIQTRFGRVDALVACAGILASAPIGMISAAKAKQAMDVNVMGSLWHVQMAARFMRRVKSGAIVLLSSIFGLEGAAGQSVYAASKAALCGMARASAKELGGEGIRVNVIAPGMIETDMLRELTDEVRAARLQNIAMKRTGTPDEVAALASFLVSDQSRYITGQIIGIDGGMVI